MNAQSYKIENTYLCVGETRIGNKRAFRIMNINGNIAEYSSDDVKKKLLNTSVTVIGLKISPNNRLLKDNKDYEDLRKKFYVACEVYKWLSKMRLLNIGTNIELSYDLIYLLRVTGDVHNLVLPPVLVINDDALKNNKTLDSVIIPNTVERIHRMAFRSCTGLKSIEFNSNLQYLGEHSFSNAFYEHLNYKCNIKLVGSIEKICEKAFYRSNIASVKIENTVGKEVKIENFAFEKSTVIAVELGDSVTEIGKGIFSYCNQLKYIKLSKNITTIPMEAFNECINLQTVNIPEGVRVVDALAFRECKGLLYVTLPKSLTTIGYHAFPNDKKIKFCVPPGSYAERFCIENKLTYIYI